jgi:hypothetical protein
MAIMGLKLNFATQPIYLFATATVKVSIRFFLLRIAPNKLYQNFLKGMIIFLVVYTTTSFLELILQCRNLTVLWDSSVTTTCWNWVTLRDLSYMGSGINIITDLLFAALQIPMLWNVQIKARVRHQFFASWVSEFCKYVANANDEVPQQQLL